ncbi:MAG: DUF615 domain-containing protein [Desulfovibrio sp.]|nr:DUF615 domain-containing protein [Desulfovibrio sp.]
MARPTRYQWRADGHMDEDERPSRSEMKRRATAMQKLGEQFASLPPQKRTSLELPPDMKTALHDLDTMTNFEARRRQKQYIGRLMREADDTVRQRIQRLVEDA